MTVDIVLIVDTHDIFYEPDHVGVVCFDRLLINGSVHALAGLCLTVVFLQIVVPATKHLPIFDGGSAALGTRPDVVDMQSSTGFSRRAADRASVSTALQNFGFLRRGEV